MTETTHTPHARVTRRAVRDALAAAGFEGVEVVQGAGYWYFTGGGAERWHTTMVCVQRIGSLTVDQWVAEARVLRERNR
jgi:hypothetical protein